jgi:chemotaxis protein CheX
VKAEYINPFISSAVEVFSTMLDCEITRGKLSLSTGHQPTLDISGVVGLSGKASGTVVLSFSREVAVQSTEKLLGQKYNAINSDVIDAVGELTNMIAGRAKAGLEHLAMTLALPTVVTGKNHIISFGSAAQTIRIPFVCGWGDFILEVGLVEHELGESGAAGSLQTAGAC